MPSRSKMSRDAAPAAAGPSDADVQAAFGRPAGRPVTDLLDPAVGTHGPGPAAGGQPDGRDAARNRPERGRLLGNWRVRSRLVLLIAIPTATAVALGGSSIVSSWRSAVNYQRITTLATLTAKVTSLAFELEYERDNTVWYLALKTGKNGLLQPKPTGAAKAQLQVVRQQYVYTDKWIGPVRAGVTQISSGYPPGVAQDARSVASELDFIPSVRKAALTAQTSAIDVIDRYSAVIDVLLAFEDQIALSSNDPQLTSTISALSQISRLENEYSIQRGIVVFALTTGHFAQNMFQMLTASVANQNSDFAQFLNFASVRQNELYKVALATGSLADRVAASEASVIQNQYLHPNNLNTIGINPEEWFGNVRETIGKVRDVEQVLVAQAITRAQALRKKAIISAVVIGAAVLLVLIISLLFTVMVGRSMVRPLRRLRAGALEVAGVRLPETVRRMSESDSDSIPIDVEPIDVESFDEIGEVARAFDQVHREALRLAANEAALRGNVNAMFVNLSRRSQSLVERQIRLIDELEQGEQDPERLGSLFQMDHLATRMRRNSENLLVLAGHDSTRRWTQPVPLVDVLRAAISEIEQYERVTLNVQPGISVRGPAVNDVVHLIAELAENATSFSSADTPVSVSGHLLSSGGVLLDITDLGVGMGGEEMAHANWRLDNPPVVDVAVSRRMGLFVVARLAARHGIRVRLRPATGVGLTALVWLPDEVVVREGAARPASPAGRFPEPLARFAIGQGPAGLAADSGGTPGSALPVAGGATAFAADASAAGDWLVAGPSTEQEVAAARAPRFSPQDEAKAGLGPQRVPGAGPHPGRFGGATTGPLPAIPADGPAPAEPDMVTGTGGWPSPAAAGAGAEAAAAEPSAEMFGSTGEMPAFMPDHPSLPSQSFANEWSAPPVFNTGEEAGEAAEEVPPWGTGELARSSDPWLTSTPGGMWGVTRPVPHTQDAVSAEPAETAAWPGEPAAVPEPAEAESDEQPEHAVLGAPVSSLRGSRGSFLGTDQEAGSANGVIVPPAAALEEENRLPIFEAVESDWFRRGRPGVDIPAGKAVELAPAKGWSSPADEGWKKAAAAAVPTSGGTTLAGLPRRVPKANLIPGTAQQEAAAPVPARSAAATRDRFASLQRGMREGRAASGAGKSDGASDVPGDG